MPKLRDCYAVCILLRGDLGTKLNALQDRAINIDLLGGSPKGRYLYIAKGISKVTLSDQNVSFTFQPSSDLGINTHNPYSPNQTKSFTMGISDLEG